MRSRTEGRTTFAHGLAAGIGDRSPWNMPALADRRAASIAAEMVGVSAEIASVAKQIEKIARADACVLVCGETGSGKELAARSIHQQSARKGGPFVALNCGAVPDGLIETELFGHVKGAFTDAREGRLGVIALAHGGTLFLDEADALSSKAQVTLLRFLQDYRYRPVGTANEISSNVRIVAATNQDLQALVDDGRFRRDLLYRLDIFELWIPPLRGRRDDIELLANHFIQIFSGKYGISGRRLHPATLEWLRGYEWPGNVRELENWIHRSFLLAEGDEICGSAVHTRGMPPATAATGAPDLRSAKAQAVADFEATYVARTLATARGNITVAAKLAGTERRAFGKLLKKYGIDKSRYHS